MVALRVIILTVILFGGYVHSCADIIHLKSGRKVEGTVLESTDDGIVVEMAMGSVTLSRSNILKIERDHEGNKRRGLLNAAQQFESDILEIKRSITSLNSENGKLSVTGLRVKRHEAEVHRSEERLAELQKDRVTALEELKPYIQYRGKRVPSRIYDQYIAAELKYETATAQVNSLEQELANQRRELAHVRGIYNKSRSELVQKLNLLHLRRGMLSQKGCPDEALVAVDRGIRNFDDLKQMHQIPLRREGNSFIIKVTLNDKVTEDFILDTGCSLILLTEAVAKRLDLDADVLLEEGVALIADGTAMRVRNIYLDSVEVGGIRVGNVAAQISSSKGGNTPLLLGMSFLERFRFSIDSQRGLLILE